ncbi:immunoglobulin domain-containing protein oig-4-like [Macrobrachium nipponense]|uniref:immunoglobulin domain-containing protein oig-4-like n=1 Tax=Macrobrachium nipponense TaxID=159736 RepID=UPI0030C83938
MRAQKVWLCLVVLLMVMSTCSAAKKGGRRTKGGRTNMKDKGAITRFKTPESQAYYDHDDGAKITLWSHFESEYILGRKIVFMCVAEGTPRPTITWFKDGIELYAHSFFQVHEWKDDERSIKSKMEIDPATQMDAGYYECQADNKYAVDVHGFSADYTISFV